MISFISMIRVDRIMNSILNRKELLLGLSICIVGLLTILLNLPWTKPEIIEDGRIVRVYDDGSCVIETSREFILNVWDCSGYKLGDEVQVRYREDTSLADIISSKE